MKQWIIVLFLLFGLGPTVFGQNEILLPAKLDNRWGFINGEGQWVIHPIYSRCLTFDNRDYTWVEKGSDNYLIDRKGNTLLNLSFGDIVSIHNDVVVYRQNHLLGWFNKTTKNHISPQYTSLEYLDFSAQFKFQDSTGYGILDLQGLTVLDPIYELIEVADSFYHIYNKGKIGLFAFDGLEIAPIIFDKFSFHKDFIVGQQDKKDYTIFNRRGDSLLSGKFDNLEFICNNHFVVEKHKSKYLLDANTSTVVDTLAQYYAPFASNRILVMKDSNLGLFNTVSNDFILPTQYQNIHTQSGSSNYITRFEGLYGINDSNGKLLTPHVYEVISNFNSKGICEVRRDQKWGLINLKGKEILPCKCNVLTKGSDDVVKCRYYNYVSLYEFDSLQRLVDSIQFTNANTIDLGGKIDMDIPSGAVANQTVSSLWFMDAKGRWGLMKPDGTEFLPPFFTDIRKIKGTNYVLCSTRYMRDLYADSRFRVSATTQYALIDEIEFRKMTPPGVLYIDTSSVSNNSHRVFRIMLTSGFCATVNKSTAKVMYYNSKYIGKFINGYARVFVGGNVFYSYSNKKYIELQSLQEHASDFNLVFTSSDWRSRYSYLGIGYWAYINVDGKYINTPYHFKTLKIQSAGNFILDRAIVMFKDSLYGLIDQNGEFVLNSNYKTIQRLSNTDNRLLLVEIYESRYGYVSQTGNVLTFPQFTKANDFSGGLAWAYNDSRTILLNKSGIKKEFEGYYKTFPFSEGMAGYADDYRYALIDSNGVQTTGFLFSKIDKCTEGLTPLRQKGGYGFADANGNFVINSTYKKAYSYSQGLAVVRVQNKRKSLYGYINKSGTMVIPPKFNKAASIDSNGFAEVRKGSNRGFVNRYGKQIIPAKYSKIFYGDGVIVAGKGWRTVIYNTEGKKIKRLIAKVKYAPSSGCIVLNRYGKYGVVDLKGSNILPFKYKQLRPFENNVSVFQNGRDCYIINLAGDTLSKHFGRAIEGFSCGYLLVKQEGAYHYYNADGQSLFNLTFDMAKPFENNLAIVKVGGKYGLLDNHGFYRIFPNYDQVNKPSEGYSIVAQHSLMGVTDLNGKYVIAPECNKITYINTGQFQFTRNNAFGYFNLDGTILYDPK